MRGALAQNLELSEIETIVKGIEAEKEAEAEKKRTRLAASAQVGGRRLMPEAWRTGG